MKITPLLLAGCMALLLTVAPRAARADDVTFDVFYNSLSNDGEWYNTPEYGYVFQPDVAYNNDKWRPYTDGYWAQTEDGWTWVAYENFGWATYHYGRWTRIKDTGWVWVPGYEWGPGWVSWRTNDDYVGWAPLPPKPHSHPGGGQGAGDISIDYNDVEPQDGYTSNVDVDYDIGPSHYCFVPVNDFGAPVLVQVIVPSSQNITIIEHTTNVTNIVYQNGGGNIVVINNGPNYQYLSHHVNHPIQHLILEHHNDVNYLHEHLKGGNPTLVKNGTLFVPSPFIDHRRVNFNQTKPVTVKREIRDARVEHGWRNSGADQPTVQRLRTQFQDQAREHPSRQPGNPTANTTPAPNDVRRDRERNNVPPTPGAAPTTAGSQPFNRTDDERRARRDAAQHDREARENGGQPTPGATPSRDARPSTATPTLQANPNQDPRHHNPRPTETPAATPQASNSREDRRNQPKQENAQPSATPENRRNPSRQPENAPANTPAATAAPADKQHEDRQSQRRVHPDAQPSATPAQNNAAESERRAERKQAQEQRQPAQTTPNPAREQQPQQAQQHQQEQKQHEQVQQTPQHQPEQAQRRQEPQAQPSQPAKSDDDKKKRRDGTPQP